MSETTPETEVEETEATTTETDDEPTTSTKTSDGTVEPDGWHQT
ncbi:hypothetical protein [Streptomyces sp. NBC_01262]|jgi:hypothetical protein|nr:hypothetical protein [Streptomyces sp. NBC_01262]